jgi:hypothetical protein
MKHISTAMWETLNRSRFANEKLAWDGVDSVEEVFITPQETL